MVILNILILVATILSTFTVLYNFPKLIGYKNLAKVSRFQRDKLHLRKVVIIAGGNMIDKKFES